MNPSPDHQAASWDKEYAGGRYRDEPPVAFVADILAAARRAGLTSGLYIGCGNGRNYEALVRGGLDLTGLDISEVALRQLSARMPERRGALVRGDLSALPEETRYGVVIGIQVFQHGDAEAAHAHLAAARARVAPGGLMAVRVNAAGTDIAFAHRLTGRNDDGVTIRYLDGPKAGPRFTSSAKPNSAVSSRSDSSRCCPRGPRSPGDSPPGRPVDPVGRHLACYRLRPGHAPGEHPCAAPADLATMSQSDGRPVTQPRDRATGGR